MITDRDPLGVYQAIWCQLGYTMVYYYHDYINQHCIPCPIKGGAICWMDAWKPQPWQHKVYSCQNGYPSSDFTSCILRDNLTQAPDPIPNCEFGGRSNSDRPYCQACKLGFARRGDDYSSCEKLTDQPRGCVSVNETGKCTGCNLYLGYLTTDTNVSDCYRLEDIDPKDIGVNSKLN